MRYIIPYCKVEFPSPSSVNINMMPFIFGDEKNTIPPDIGQYIPMIRSCRHLTPKSICYLSIRESFVQEGKTQSRPGLHTERAHLQGFSYGWGGGGWGGGGFFPLGPMHGIYMASNQSGSCRAWNTESLESESLVDQALINTEIIMLEANVMYWMTDKVPHEVLPAHRDYFRQWIRVVSSEIDYWFHDHSTPSPFGIQPDARIIYGNKFTGERLTLKDFRP